MRVELGLPSWTDNRGIHIFAGIEHVAYKLPWEDHWRMKVGRCSMCGQCCMKLGCPYLEKEPGDNDRWRCREALAMPYTCLISRGRSIDECTVKFEEIR